MGCGSCGLISGFAPGFGVSAPVVANNVTRSRRGRRANRRNRRANRRNNNVVAPVVDSVIAPFARNGFGCCGCGCLDGFFCCGGIGYSADPLLYDW
jgi:hypothetical protein